jgi:hypothetical protein
LSGSLTITNNTGLFTFPQTGSLANTIHGSVTNTGNT